MFSLLRCQSHLEKRKPNFLWFPFQLPCFLHCPIYETVSQASLLQSGLQKTVSQISFCLTSAYHFYSHVPIYIVVGFFWNILLVAVRYVKPLLSFPPFFFLTSVSSAITLLVKWVLQNTRVRLSIFGKSVHPS